MLTAMNDTTEQISWQDTIVDEVKMMGKVAELIHSASRRQTIVETARKLNIQPTATELQAAADNFRRVNQLETVAATCEWLEARCISVSDLEKIVDYQLTTEKLAHHLFADKVPAFFQQNLLEYSSAAIYEVVLTERYVAMELFYALEEGDLNFTDVARQYIEDPELKRRGGYLGNIYRRQLRPEISAAVFAAKPPQTIEPITTSLGIHLIRVEEIVQPQLDSTVYQQILMSLFDSWLERQTIDVSARVPQMSLP